MTSFTSLATKLSVAAAAVLLSACGQLAGPSGGQASPASQANRAATTAAAPTNNSVNARQAIVLTAPERAQVLKEMNEFLGAIHDIHSALAKKDFAAAASAAQAMGPRGGQHDAVGARLHDKLPQAWFGLARPTHQQFLSVARAAQSATSVDAVMQALADTTRQCVACHAIYRLEVQP